MHTSHGEPAPQSPESNAAQPNGAPQSSLPPFAPQPDPPNPGSDPKLAPDLRSPLRILDLAVLVLFYLIAGTAITIGLVFVSRYVFGVSSAALQNSTSAKNLLILVSQSLLSGATLLFLYGLVRSRSDAPFWPAVGWRRFRGIAPPLATAAQFLFGGCVLALLTGFFSRFLDRDVVLPMEQLLRNRQSILLLMALGVLVAPAVEETIFRGCIYPILARRLGIGASIFATGLLFGLAHAPQLWPGYGQIALLIFVGIVLTYVRARTGTVTASFLVHLGYNVLLFGGFLWSTSGLRHLPS